MSEGSELGRPFHVLSLEGSNSRNLLHACLLMTDVMPASTSAPENGVASPQSVNARFTAPAVYCVLVILLRCTAAPVPHYEACGKAM